MLVALAYGLIFSLFILRSKFFGEQKCSRFISFSIFLMKVLAAFGLIYIYTFVYQDKETADIYKYHYDAEVMASAFQEDPAAYFSMLSGIGDEDPVIQQSYYDKMGTWRLEWDNGLFNDCHTIIRLTSVLYIFSGGSIWAMGIIIAFLSFLAMWLIGSSFQLFGIPRLLTLLFLLLPSILFWTSGLLKEGYLIIAISLLIYGFFNWLKGVGSRKAIISMLIGFLFLLYLKIYVLAILLPGLVGLAISLRMTNRSPMVIYLMVFLLCLLLVPVLPLIDPDWNLIAQLVQKQKDFFGLIREYNPGSEISIPELNTSWLSFIKAAPVAIWNVLTRPHIFEAKGILQYISATENLIIVGLLTSSLIQKVSLNHEQKALVLFLVFFMILETLIIGWVTPIAGAIVRYKVPVLIFLAPFLALRFSSFWNKKAEKFIYLHLK